MAKRNDAQDAHSLCDYKEVARIFGLKAPRMVHEAMKKQGLLPPVRLSENRLRWVRAECDDLASGKMSEEARRAVWVARPYSPAKAPPPRSRSAAAAA
jgi:predicted DNA-binding transcriptional regulator AlpA